MGLKGAVAPWNALGAARMGRSWKPPEPSEPSGCVWPAADGSGGSCRKPTDQGMALCAAHVGVLSEGSGQCAWPRCQQGAFGVLCTYHDKRARGLIGHARKRGR